MSAILKHLSKRLICRYAAYCAARAEVRERKHDADLENFVPGIFAACPDGVFAMAREGSTWSLWLEWSGYGRRLLAQGTWEYVQRYAMEVTIHGPPGGPDLREQGSSWRDIGGDGTLHSLTHGGEFRLMPLFDEGHILAFSHNEAPLRVLGVGDVEELQDRPDKRLQHVRGDVLHVYIGGERVDLRGVAAAGVLGYLELHDGARLLLGHLDGEHFGLFFVHGTRGECVGLYDFDMLRRGNLGEVLAWAWPGDRDDEAGRAGDDLGRTTAVHAPASLGTRHPPHQSAREVPRAQGTATPPQLRPRPAPQRTTLSADDLLTLDQLLTLLEPATGPGATMVPKLLECLRALVRLNLPNLLLRGCDLRDLIKLKLNGVELHCCAKTLGRALDFIARHTPLLKRVGKRWSLPLGDLLIDGSELRRWIATASALATSEDEQPVRPAAPHEPEPPARNAPPVAAHQPPASSTTPPQPEPPASSTSPRHPEPPPSSTTRPEPPVSQAVPASPVREPGHPSPPTGEPAPTVGPPGDREQLATLDSVLARGDRRYQHPDDIMRVSMASLPDSESASRWLGRKKPRGPP